MAVSFAGFSVRMIFLYSAAVSLSGGTGSEKLTAVPPSVLRALMLPPCAFTMDMHTEADAHLAAAADAVFLRQKADPVEEMRQPFAHDAGAVILHGEHRDVPPAARARP